MDVSLLNRVLSQPTAPFREGHVAAVVEAYLRDKGVPHFRDPIGNLVVGVASEAAYRDLVGRASEDPVCVYIAHMDHPGFHGEKWLKEDRLAVKWYGGSPRRGLVGAPVWVADASGLRGEGKILKAKVAKHGRGMESAEIQVKGVSKSVAASGDLFGAFRFTKPIWKVGDRIYTKAADDLVGVSTIVSLAASRQKDGGGPAFLGVLTRAEEVGFIGCIGHVDLGWLRSAKRPVLCVSLETSRTLPGAIPGKGPVVRLGDRATTFDPGCVQLFHGLAQKTLGKKFQRRIMDGGTCEGTVSTAFGFPTIAISIPLGNYHNEAFEGGPQCRGKLGPGPEFVHLSDVKGMYRLCEAILQPGVPWTRPWEAKVGQLRELYKKMKPLLGLS